MIDGEEEGSAFGESVAVSNSILAIGSTISSKGERYCEPLQHPKSKMLALLFRFKSSMDNELELEMVIALVIE